MSLMERMKKSTTIKEAAVLSTSKFFNKKDMVPTLVPMLNVALSGSLTGGLAPGLSTIAGPSKHFKTGFLLTLIKAYLDKYPEAICIFYDSEFGTPQGYFKAFGIDMDRVLHVPIKDLEVFKFDLMARFDDSNEDRIKRGDKVLIAVDSVGNLASKKEIEDAQAGKSTADMTRAKVGKSVARMVTPNLMLNDIPMVVINHTYKTQEMYAKDVVSGGTGWYYSSDNIWIIGRQQEKEGDELVGYNFVINIEKSRYVKEKSKIIIEARHESGISKWSGLLDVATEAGHIKKCKIGNSAGYQRVNMETGEIEEKKYKTKDTYCAEFWIPILTSKPFAEFIEKKYKVAHVEMISDDDIEKAFNTVVGAEEDGPEDVE